MEGIIFFLIITIICIAIPVAIARAKKINQTWTRVAGDLGLQFTPGSLTTHRKIGGNLKGLRVEVYTFSRGSGKNRRTYTGFKAHFPQALGLGLALTSGGFFSKVTKFFGAQDIEVGDQGFDDEVIVKGTDPEGIIDFLTPARRARIRRCLLSFPGTRIDDEGITWNKRGVVSKPETITDSLVQLTTITGSLLDEPEQGRVLDKAIKARQEGRIDDALAIIEETGPSPETEAVEEKVIKGGILLLGGKTEAAKEVFSEAAAVAPQDPEIKGWVERLETEGEGAPTTPKPAAEELTVARVCEALFGAGISSFDADKIFADRFAGQKVKWTGKLRSVESFYFDMVFGNEKGAKATVEIHEIKANVYSENMVLALVQIPESAISEWRNRRGEEVTLTGTLLKPDSFMKNIFIGQGQITAGS